MADVVLVVVLYLLLVLVYVDVFVIFRPSANAADPLPGWMLQDSKGASRRSQGCRQQVAHCKCAGCRAAGRRGGLKLQAARSSALAKYGYVVSLAGACVHFRPPNLNSSAARAYF